MTGAMMKNPPPKGTPVAAADKPAEKPAETAPETKDAPK
jgi:hypothetical protein